MQKTDSITPTKQKIAQIQIHIEEIRQSIIEKINSLPDNPRINRIGNTRAFIISFSDLGNNWTVEHHDFKKQYEMIAAEIEVAEPFNILSKLEKIIEEEGFRHKECYVTLHKDVLSHLKSLVAII